MALDCRIGVSAACCDATGLVVGAFFGANGKAATERATTENDGWTTYYDASGAITRRKVTSERPNL